MDTDSPSTAASASTTEQDEAATSSSTLSEEITSTVRKAAASIIPYLLISPPFLPSEIKSAELNLRHNMLSITSEDADQYLVTSHSNSDRDVGTKVISLLDEIRSLAESLHNETDDDTGGAIKLVGKVLFSEPEKGKIMASVELGDQQASKASLLSLYLKHEASSEDMSESKGYQEGGSWKYDNLLPLGQLGGLWTSTFQESSTAPYISSTANATEATLGSYDTAGSAGFESARDDSDEATEAAHSRQPQAEYHNSAEDFWGGYSDDEESKALVKTSPLDSADPETEEAKEEREKKEEAAYWDSYDDGSGDTAPSMTQDDSGYSNDDTYEDSYDSNYNQGAFSNTLSKELPKDLSPELGPARLGTPNMENVLPLPTRPELNPARSHIRESGSYDSRRAASPRPPSPSEADYRVGLAPTSQERVGQNGDDRSNGNNKEENQGNWNGSDDERTENDHGNAISTGQDLYSLAEVLPPRGPESVVAPQSTFETPNNMSLSELEQYYRSRHQEARAVTKGRRGGRYGDDEEEDAHSDHSNKSNIPGLETFQLPSDLNRAQQYVDPIDALIAAQPEVGLGDLSEMVERKQKEEARRNRSVPRQASMETLKKLAEEQEEEEGRKRSDSVGFRNFLQMAPSTVFSMNQQEEDEEEEPDFQSAINRNSPRPDMDRSQTFDGPTTRRDRDVPSMPPPINLRYDPSRQSSNFKAPPSLPGLDDLTSSELDKFVLPGRQQTSGGNGYSRDEDADRSGLFDRNGNSIDQPGQRSFFQAASTIASTRPMLGSVAPPSQRVGAGLEPLTDEEDGEDTYQYQQDYDHLGATRNARDSLNRPSTPDSIRVGFAPDTLRKLERERLRRRGGEEAEQAEEEERREKEEQEANRWAEELDRKRENQRQMAARRGGATGPIRGGRGSNRGGPIRGGRGGAVRGAPLRGVRAQAEYARMEALKSPTIDTSQSLPDLNFDDTRSLDANDGDMAEDVDSTALGPESSTAGGGASISPDPRFANRNEPSGLTAQLKTEHLRKQRLQAQQAQRERINLQRQRQAQINADREQNEFDEDVNQSSRPLRGGMKARDVPPPSPPHRGGNTPGDSNDLDQDPFDQVEPSRQKGVKQRGANASRAQKDDGMTPQARRMALVQATKARNDNVKEIMKGAWRMMATITLTLPTTGPSPPQLTETDFLRVAREAVRDCLNESSSSADEPLSNGSFQQSHRQDGYVSDRNGGPLIRGMPKRGKNPQGVRNAEFMEEKEQFRRERERKDREMRGERGWNGDQDYGYEDQGMGGRNGYQDDGYYEDDYENGSATEREY